jgi:hypothetical protein
MGLSDPAQELSKGRSGSEEKENPTLLIVYHQNMTLTTCQQLQSYLLFSLELYTLFVSFILSFLMNDRNLNWHGKSDASTSNFTDHIICMGI